jgi:molybdopterin converting factor small subunit
MPLVIHIPGPLRAFTYGRAQVDIALSPANLCEALEALWAQYPGLRDRLVTEQGQVREHINLFVGDEDVRYTGGLTTALPPDAEIWIIPAISGGAASIW